MTKAFVVCQIGYEYNDEINTRPESGGGTPIKVFRNEISAKKECNSANLQFLRNHCEDNFGQYCYELHEAVDFIKLGHHIPRFDFDPKRGSLEEVQWLEILKVIEEIEDPIKQYIVIHDVFSCIDLQISDVLIED